MLLVKQYRSDDNSLDEKIVIKPHLQPLDLQGELIILIFVFNTMLRTKICIFKILGLTAEILIAAKSPDFAAD